MPAPLVWLCFGYAPRFALRAALLALLLVGGALHAQYKVLYGAEALVYHQNDTAYAPTGLLQNGGALNLARLKRLRLAVVANQTSRVFERTHLVDTLQRLGYNLTKVFAPEHGFRGTAEAGDTIHDGRDVHTGIAVVSLFGKKLKPAPDDLRDVDAVLFDVQDVGCRFYTYLSTLALIMEACAENGKELVVLDRPNPNGWYMDGPVLDTAQRSFVGLHPVPIVHGLTLGEYARMANHQRWLPGGKTCTLTVVPMQGYTHRMLWEDTGRQWVPPSPNLSTPASARYYPILCWYEGTVASVGRGTPWPFTVVGMPGFAHAANAAVASQLRIHAINSEDDFALTPTTFVPVPIAGKAANPLQRGKVCNGMRLSGTTCNSKRLFTTGLALLAAFYNAYQTEACGESGGSNFFNPYVEKLMGTDKVRLQITTNISTFEIYDSWQPGLLRYKSLASRYLLYKQ